MSLATSIKDFADLLTEISASRGLTGDFPKALLLQQILIYSGKAFISLILYLLSFEWLKDISYLPLIAPQINGASVFGDSLSNNPASHIFSFSSIPKQGTNQLFSGFLNSFFFSLPVSLPHLVSLRRLFFQGPVAAAASLIGIVAAHSIFLASILYGFRFLIIPYLYLEPLNYVLGIGTVAFLVKGLAEQKGFRLVPAWDKKSLRKICAISFLLTWCEETNLFHSLNHVTLNANNTYFDLYPCNTALHCFVIHTTYLLAFCVGHCLFSAFFYYLLFIGSRSLSSLRYFTTRTVTSGLSQLMLFLIVAFTVSSFPYYGLDYLVTQVGGFLPEDPAYSNTFFSPQTVKTKHPHFFKELAPAKRDQETPLNLDLNLFDRGMYLNAPNKQKNTESSIVMPALSFEELNYQGEYAWIMRNQLSKELSKMRPSVLTPAFKKPRRKYLQLRKLNDNRLEQAVRIAHNKKTIGQVADTKEGLLPGENAPFLIKLTDFLGRTFDLPREVESQMQNFEISDSLTSKSQKSQQPLQEKQEQEKGKEKHIDFLASTKNKKKDPIKEELLFERKIQKSYSKGFAPSFSLPYERTRFRSLPVKNVIKKRYFLNNVYKNLLEIDIDTFLARQPAAYKLAENQEFQLYEKRQILQKYYNWLRYYQPFEKMMQLHFQIPDSKSFVDRVYHQQFKGTLRIARRLFKVTFDSQQNPLKNRVLSYDQMLYKDLSQGENPFLHEELFDKEKAVVSSKNDSILYPTFSPFIEESSSSPTYAGWDPLLRRFVVTNRFVLKAIDK